VLAFHLGMLKTPGGFIGVDVFFVISGYLISYIVFSEVANSRFSIISFYERRIRRIFPALFAMLAAFTVFAIIYLLPKELSTYGVSLLATTGSVANFYFWLHSGYFNSPESNPLLHTWSLGVEEQFYIVFPLFLIVIRRFFPQRLQTAVVVLFFLSLAASAWVVVYHPITAFYMLYTRAWELLMGTALSLGMFPRLRGLISRNAATLIGISLIAYADVYFSKTTLFPGLSALVPCVGAALIIGAGESGSSVVGSILAWKPIVFIGLISYSLYLWHWPVVVVQGLGVFGPMQHGLVAIASLILGTLSWRFVERPFRSGKLRLTGRPLFITAAAVMAVSAVVATSLILTSGIKGRFPARAERVASLLGDTKASGELVRADTCFLLPENNYADYKPDVCLHRDPAKKNSYLLIGDSHSAILWNAFAQNMPDANILQASATPCGPFPHPVGSDACKQMMTFVFEHYLIEHPVQALLLSKRWSGSDAQFITETVQWAKDHHVPVILLGPVPEYDEELPRLLAYSIAWNKPDLPARHLTANSPKVDAQFQKLAATVWHVPYVSLYQAICNGSNCTEYADAQQQVPLMGDRDHFSREGALLIIKRLIDNGQFPNLSRTTSVTTADNAKSPASSATEPQIARQN
jgi:peptidoglycan/LPS O-acetylase OafA/YrhL